MLMGDLQVADKLGAVTSARCVLHTCRQMALCSIILKSVATAGIKARTSHPESSHTIGTLRRYLRPFASAGYCSGQHRDRPIANVYRDIPHKQTSPLQPTAGVKNTWSYSSIYPYVFMSLPLELAARSGTVELQRY